MLRVKFQPNPRPFLFTPVNQSNLATKNLLITNVISLQYSQTLNNSNSKLFQPTSSNPVTQILPHSADPLPTTTLILRQCLLPTSSKLFISPRFDWVIFTTQRQPTIQHTILFPFFSPPRRTTTNFLSHLLQLHRRRIRLALFTPVSVGWSRSVIYLPTKGAGRLVYKNTPQKRPTEERPRKHVHHGQKTTRECGAIDSWVQELAAASCCFGFAGEELWAGGVGGPVTESVFGMLDWGRY